MQVKLWGVLTTALAVGSCGGSPPARELTQQSALTTVGPVAVVPAAPDSVNGNGFGNSIAIDGDTAVISSYGTNGKGVFVFRGAGTSWVQVAKLVPPDDSPPTGWGMDVAILAWTHRRLQPDRRRDRSGRWRLHVRGRRHPVGVRGPDTPDARTHL